LLQVSTTQTGGGPLSGGDAVHDPSVLQTWPEVAQFSQAEPPRPQTAALSPNAHDPAALQHPPQVIGPHAGAGPSSSVASTPSLASSFEASGTSAAPPPV
jgi:hypothetical protein